MTTMDPKHFMLLATVLLLAPRSTTCTNTYAMYIVHGMNNALQWTDLRMRMFETANPASTNLGLQLNNDNDHQEYISPLTPSFPWTYSIQDATSTSGFFTYNIIIGGNFDTLCPNQTVLVDVCFSGIGTGTTRAIASYVAGIETVQFYPPFFFGYSAWETFSDGVARNLCTQTTFTLATMEGAGAFRIQLWTPATGGTFTTTDDSSHAIRIRTVPTQQPLALGATYKALYVISGSLSIYLDNAPNAEIRINNVAAIAAQTEFPTAPAWTFLTSPRSGATNALVLTITDATKLANQRMEVDLVLSGGAANGGENVYVYMTFNSTAGNMVSYRSWDRIPGNSYPAQMSASFMIPNQYLVNSATMHFYGYTTRNGGTTLSSSLTFQISVATYRIQLD